MHIYDDTAKHMDYVIQKMFFDFGQKRNFLFVSENIQLELILKLYKQQYQATCLDTDNRVVYGYNFFF